MKEIELVVDGVRLRALEAGSGPAVLFVHGWAASRKFWRSTLEVIGAKFRAVAIDLPGFGESDKPPRAYTIEEYAAFVGRVIDAFGAPVEAVVGHSMGGMIAARLAMDRPDAMRKLALVSAPVSGPTALFWKSRLLLAPGVRAIAFAALHAAPLRRLITRDFTHVRPLDPELQAEVMRGSYRSMVRSARSLFRTDLTDGLSMLRMPTLVVATDRDRIVRFEQYELQRARIPGVRFELIAETGHCAMVERPDAFSAVLNDFLFSVVSPRRLED